MNSLIQVGNSVSSENDAYLGDLRQGSSTNDAEDDDDDTTLLDVAGLDVGADGEGSVSLLAAHDVDSADLDVAGGSVRLADGAGHGRRDGRGRQGGEEEAGEVELHVCGGV